MGEITKTKRSVTMRAEEMKNGVEYNKENLAEQICEPVVENPTLSIWFKTVGRERFVIEAKILTIPDHSERKVSHISEILDAYVESKYKTRIDWNSFGDAYLILEGVSFPLKEVSKLIGREELNELFEYRAEKAAKKIKACIENIDDVYQKEHVVRDVKFTV